MKVLITDKVHAIAIESIEKMGYEVHYDTHITMDSLAHIISNYTGMIINSKIKMNRAMIDLGINLKFIGRLGSGMEIIDVPYAKSKGIHVLNSPEGNRDAVAEHAIGMMLAFANNLLIADDEVKNMHWHREKNRGFEIGGKTIGIIGLGHTGSCFAKKMSSWNTTLLSYDKYRSEYGPELDYIKRVDIEDILIESDIITLHLPLTEETHHMVDIKFLQKCRKRPLLINTSRGEIIHTRDLIFALQNNIIRGACLDVFENEKVDTYTKEEEACYKELFDQKNVIVSPHIAGWTHESLYKIASVLVEKIRILKQNGDL
jgi:D-3-phosphoglycerate dehydrogenase